MVTKLRKVRWRGHVEFVRGVRNQYRNLARETELNIPLEHHRQKWESSINVNLQYRVSMLIGLNWLRIRTSCGIL
jgi:hypothetical protein